MPVPFMLANYRIALTSKSKEYSYPNISLALVNTLSNLAIKGTKGITIEGREYNKAKTITTNSIKLVIGNPPSSDSNKTNLGNDFSAIDKLMDDFRPPLDSRHGRQNIQKQINNPHLQFLRWGADIIINSKQNGVLSFIVPLSFLESESYKYARKFMIENFSSLWIVALDGDARTGIRSDSIFNTLQGRAIIIFTRDKNHSGPAKFYKYTDISNATLNEKFNFFKKNICDTMELFTNEMISPQHFSLRPVKSFDNNKYNKFWGISDGENSIYIHHCSGIKLAPTSLFTHIKPGILERRCNEIMRDKGDVTEWFKGQPKPPKKEKIDALRIALSSLSTNNMSILFKENTKNYSLRPFVTTNVFLWEELLNKYSKEKGSGTRKRPEILYAFSNNIKGFAMSHAPKDLSENLSQFTSFCWHYPDNDMCRRGNSHIYLPEYPIKNSNGQFQLINNINPDIIKFYKPILLNDDKTISRRLTYYIYAILCSQAYLDEFEGALFSVHGADNRARVPLTINSNRFNKLCALGEKLASLEKTEDNVPNHYEYDIENIKSRIIDGSILMSAAFDTEREKLILLFNNTNRYEIQIDCSIESNSKKISGYNVLDEWIKYHTYKFTHCEFNKEDLEELLLLINKLKEHSLLVAKIDTEVLQLLDNSNELFAPPIS